MALLLLAIGPVRAAAQAPRFDLDGLRKLVRINDVALSPDGSRVAVVVSRPNFDQNRYDGELLLIDAATGTTRSLSHDRWSMFGPTWSPDGTRIAFMSMSDAKDAPGVQVFVLPVAGGEARRVTSAKEGVDQYAWNPAAGEIAYATADTAAVRTGEERYNDSFEVGDDDYLIRAAAQPVHLWVVPDTGGTARRVTSGTWSLAKADGTSAMSYSPDGKQIVVAIREDAHSGGFPERIRLVDVATGTTRVLGSGFATNPVFSPDGRSVLISKPRGAQPIFTSNGLAAVDLATGNERLVSEQVDRNFWQGRWVPGSGTVIATAADGTAQHAWLFAADGKATRLELGEVEPIEGISASKTGVMAFAGATSAHPAEVYVMGGSDRAPRRLTNLNAAIEGYGLGRVEGIEWDVPKGMRADGVVTYPPGYQAGRKYPLLLWIHGGPMGSNTVGFSEFVQYLAAQGWVIFQPNYRGSTNRGKAYQGAIVGDAGDGPGKDVMAGVAMLIGRGIVDSTRMAVSGWSYGGYMTTWLMGHYPVWKAAVAGAAVTDFADAYTLSDINVAFGAGWGGSIYSDQFEALVRAQSPITSWRTMKAPTLILSDVGDARVPITQSFKLYHALKDRGVPVKFVAYPIGGHFPRDPVRSRDILRRLAEWVTPYLR